MYLMAFPERVGDVLASLQAGTGWAAIPGPGIDHGAAAELN
jgi:hypothetical protein